LYLAFSSSVKDVSFFLACSSISEIAKASCSLSFILLSIFSLAFFASSESIAFLSLKDSKSSHWPKVWAGLNHWPATRLQ